MKKILVLGYIVRGPLGGLVFHHLQYVLGLQRLGYEVLFLEDSEDYPACYDPSRNQLTEDATYGLHFIRQVFTQYGLAHNWAYYDAHQNHWYGRSVAGVQDFCAGAELLLNLSGSNPLRSWTEKIPRRIYVDTDPVFTQIHNLQKPDARERCAAHTRHFTFGENIGQADCSIPDDGFHWLSTRQPVVPAVWSQRKLPSGAPFSTVMQWDSYRELIYSDRRFGMKSASFDPYFTLPERVASTFCLAMGSATAPLDQLQKYRWQVRDAQEVTSTPASYQQFISDSLAEWSVAKHGYVDARSGWFSERSCAYLASGRPVVVQDTGFSNYLPVGRGIYTFNNVDEAVAAIQKVEQDGAKLEAACLALIAEFFDYRVVLPPLLEE